MSGEVKLQISPGMFSLLNLVSKEAKRMRQALQVAQIVDNHRNCCQICCHITPYRRSEDEGSAMHFTPNCTHCPGVLACLAAELQARTSVISITRKIFAVCWVLICASGSVTAHRSLGASSRSAYLDPALIKTATRPSQRDGIRWHYCDSIRSFQ